MHTYNIMLINLDNVDDYVINDDLQPQNQQQ